MTKKAFIAGYYGFGNTGDEAILSSIVAHLRELVPDLQITATSATPEITAAAHGIGAILWSDAHAMFEAVRGCDLVIVGGGGIFHDYHGVDPAAVLTDSHSGLSFYAGPAIMAVLCGKPVMLYAVGVGPLFSEPAQRLTKIAFDAAAAISVRDAGSRALLESIGVCADRVVVTADPAFGVPARRDPAEIASLPGLLQNGPLIAVALRYWDAGVQPQLWEQEVAAGLDRFLERHPGSILFVPFQRLEMPLGDDAVVSARVQALMRLKERTSVVAEAPSPEQIYTLLGECSLVVGMRLHSLILGMKARVRVLALSYDPKVDQVMERTGLNDFTLDIRSLDAEALASRMDRALASEQCVDLAALTEEARSNARIAASLLDRPQEPAIINPEVASLLARAIQVHLRDSRDLRVENTRLFHEVEYYLELGKTLSATADENSARAALLERNKNAEIARLHREMEDSIQRERSARVKESEQQWLIQRDLQRQIKSLEAEREEQSLLQARVEEELQKKETLGREISERALKVEQLHNRILRGLDHFQHTWAAEIETHRSQRAWKAMLVIRKAYDLLMRHGVLAFTRWFLALPWSGPGPLGEYELRFPHVWNYMPEQLGESTVFSPAVPAQSRDLADFLPQHKYDLVVLPIFDFEFRFQRPQQIAAQFARAGHRIFWVSPGRFLSPSAAQPYEAIPLRENIWEVRLRGRRPDLYGDQTTPQETESAEQCLERFYRDFHVSESCVLIQFPYWRELGLALRGRFGAKLLYDCMDDWQNWTSEPRISSFSLAEERKLARECDALAVSGREFRDRYRAAGLHPILVRNGADFSHFNHPRSSDLLAEIPKPIVGYYGAIADWFDLDLLEAVARSRPQYSFVLIGQVHQVDVSRLGACPNVHLLGEKHYRELPFYLSQFDACLIPFRLTHLTKGVDPVKLYEYFSQGKPVVATDLAELPHDSDLLYIGADAQDFARKIDLALGEKDLPGMQAKIDRRVGYARANTWAARGADLDRAVSNSFPKVSILIVAYNCEEFIKPCLDSVYRNTSWPNYEVVVVDNNSTDGTKAALALYDQRQIHVTYHPENLGFAAANNLAARNATGDYIVFLNPDTIVTPGWIGRLVRHCERDPQVGAVAAVTNFSGNETKIKFDYRNVWEMMKFASTLAAEKANQSTDIGMAPLYCVLVPRKVWGEVGELDTGYQIGMFEDDDFSRRILAAGYRVIAADDCFIHHFGNGSFAKLPTPEAIRIFERNKRYFEDKWKTAWQPHTLRAGVVAPSEGVRFTPQEFLRVEEEPREQRREPPVLRRLHPPSTAGRQGFNVQSDGQSALVVECANAAPGTVIVMEATMLTTSYGKETLLSAVVPPELYARPGRRSVYLVNDFGESNRLEFEVQTSRAKPVSA